MIQKKSYLIMQENKEILPLKWNKIGNNTLISTFKSRSNHKVYIKKIIDCGDETNRVILFLFHDFGAYHARFSKLVSWLQEHYKNIDFVLMDFTGHGLSSGSRGVISSIESLSIDIEDLMNCFTKVSNDEKWYFLGHGLGALVLLELLKSKEYSLPKMDGLILSNFSLTLKSKLFELDKKWLNGFLLKKEFLNRVKWFDTFKLIDLLSDTESINKWVNDPLTLKAYSLQTASIINNKSATLFYDSYFLDKRTLILTSDSKLTNDAITDFFFKGFKKDLIDKKHYPFLKHDLYNELDNEIIFRDIANWMGK